MNKHTKSCLSSIERSAQFFDGETEILKSNKPNKSTARNMLAKKAKGEILVFIDSDAEATDFWLHELIKPFKTRSVGAVGGPSLIGSNASRKEVLADKILCFPLATWKSSSRYRVCGIERECDESELTSCNLAIRKDVFWTAGGFPQEFIPCEENVLLEQISSLGYDLVYNPMAIVFHNRAELIKPHLSKIFYYATGRGRMLRHRKGSLKLFPKPSVDFLILIIALVFHYLAYIAGLIWGFLKG